VVSCNILQVEAGTNGYRVATPATADAPISASRMKPAQISMSVSWTAIGGSEFEVTLGGDCELETMIRALKFITKVLEDESQEVYD
jgi:hypothetical protein